jgi:hypothetical protein
MNKDAEAINQFLAWLLQEPNPAITAPSGENSSQTTGPDQSGAVDLQSPYTDPLDSEEVKAMLSDLIESGSFPFEEVSLFKSGEKPAVQDRFYSLLKHRLRAEIEQNPPRFPWETEACQYDSEPSNWTVPDVVPPLWAAQLQHLSLPVPMPEGLLTQLFEQCQTVVQSSLREGEKLIQAVKDLFPGQSDALNQLAGLVLASPYRSGAPAPSQTAGFPNHYDQATPAQQMALSLLAARTILDATTFRLSAEQSTVDRQWQTAAGPLLLQATYQPSEQKVRIQAQLPDAGRLCFRTEMAEAIAHAVDSGTLEVSLSHLQLNQMCALEVQLDGIDQPPIEFAVCLVPET